MMFIPSPVALLFLLECLTVPTAAAPGGGIDVAQMPGALVRGNAQIKYALFLAPNIDEKLSH